MELTKKQLEQQDRIDNAIYEMLCKVIGEPILWDIETIGYIRQLILDGLKTEFDIVVDYPVAEEEKLVCPSCGSDKIKFLFVVSGIQPYMFMCQVCNEQFGHIDEEGK